MKFSLFLIGIVLLISGLLGYSLIDNIHSIPIERAYKVPALGQLRVNPGSVSETPENISIVPTSLNQLKINITVLTLSGDLSALWFKLVSKENYLTCTTRNSNCLVSKNVANDSITLTIQASMKYYFLLDNTVSNASKSVSLSVAVVTTSTQTTSTKDSSLNFAGLGLGLVGLLITVFGLTRKTVIPWE